MQIFHVEIILVTQRMWQQEVLLALWEHICIDISV